MSKIFKSISLENEYIDEQDINYFPNPDMESKLAQELYLAISKK